MTKNYVGHLPDLWYRYKTHLKYLGCHTVTRNLKIHYEGKKHKNVSNNVYKNVFLNIISDKVCTRLPGLCHTVRDDIITKKTFQFGHCPNLGGGFTLARFFCALFLLK